MYFEVPKRKKIVETDEFIAFSEGLDYLANFFSDLSELISLNGRVIYFFSGNSIYRYDTTLIDSSAQTLRSIRLCCSIGSLSDANTLIRKFRDDLIQFVYILNIISLRKPFVEESINNINTGSPEEFINSLYDLKYNNNHTEDELAVSAWFNNSVSDLKRPIRKKLEFENYMTVLKQNDNIKHILAEYKLQDYWETLRKRLNNYVHSNGVLFSRKNIMPAEDENLRMHLDNIKIRTEFVSSFFIVALLMIDSSLISSSDYINYLDCNLEPPEDSQYFVASFVQDFIDKKVVLLHPKIKEYLKDNNIHGMNIN